MSYKVKDVSCVNVPSAGGMVDEKLLADKLASVNFVKRPISVGILPVSLELQHNHNFVSAVRRPISEGIVPSTWMIDGMNENEASKRERINASKR